MKKKISFLIICTTIITSMVTMVACKKKTNNSTNNNSDVSVATDNSLADNAFNDVQNIADQAANGALFFYSPTYNGEEKPNNNSDEYAKSSCATITHDTISTPHILTIDFGSTNCTCNDGKSRRGVINVSYSGRYRDSASVHTITFTNYFVNDNQILGTKTVTNNGHNTNGNLNFSIVVNGQIIKANNGGTITWLSNRNREWVAGESTLLNWADDAYLITGNGSGTSANGTSYTMNITTGLHRALNCHWFDSGVVDISPSGLPTRTINYGAGSCDANATVTVNGVTYPIILN